MGVGGSRLHRRSRSLPEVERICDDRPTTSSAIRTRLASIAHSSSKRLSKLHFKRKDSSKEQSKAFVELISRWPLTHVEALLREFDASQVLLQLSDKADSARPRVPSIGEQLIHDDHRDLILTFRDCSFRVHAFLARARLALLPHPTDGRVSLDDVLPSAVRGSQLEQFIQWLYTDKSSLDAAILAQLRSSLGSVRSLASDLVRAERLAAECGDLEMMLVRDAGDAVEEGGHSGLSEARLRVDSSLVAARSPILSRLLARSSGVESEKETRSYLVLDESLLPRAFLPVIVHFLYTDELDLGLVCSSRVPCTSSLSEVRAIVAGHSPNTALHRAAHLVHIARFLGLDRLAQLCEDVLHRELSLTTAVPLLSWSLDGGSSWLARMARAAILKDLSRFLHSPHLFDLSQTAMEAIVGSQFAQATEVDILEGIVRWGEHELLRRLEQAEPNVVADTVHSVSRRGLKRSDMGSRQLKEIVSPVSSLVRVDYVLPPFHQSLTSAYQRGILERGSLRDLVVCPSTSEIDPDRHWHSPPEDAPGPRLFHPYQQAAVYVRDRWKTGETPSTSSVPPLVLSSPPRPLLPPTRHTIVEDVVVRNTMPELLDEETFNQAHSSIRMAIAADAVRFDLASLPRTFQRRMAVQLISSRVLRELGVVEEAVEILLRGEEEEEDDAIEETASLPREEFTHRAPPDLLPSSSTTSASYSALSSPVFL